MAQVSAKKRKRDGESAVKPKKKVAIDAPPATAAVSSVLRPKFCPPVIGRIPLRGLTNCTILIDER